MMKLIISVVLFWASAAWSQIVLTPKNNVNLRGEISVKPVGGQNSETIKAFKDSNFSFRKGNVNVQNNKR